MRRDTKIEIIVKVVNTIIGTGGLSSATIGAVTPINRPTKLHIPNAVPLTMRGNNQGVAIKQVH